MSTEFDSTATAQMIDLTGLPEPVIHGIRQIVETLRQNAPSHKQISSARGRQPLMGRFADLALSIPKEHIDKAQREAWSGFPRDFPESPKTS